MNDEQLMQSAQRLAQAISPERDLWPRIAAAMDDAPRRSAWTPLLAQAAAVVLLVAASSAITYVAVTGQQRPITSVSPELLFEQASFGGRYTLGPGFQDARDTLAAQLDVELERLSPESRADVEANLELVNGAIFEINAALAADPDNEMLQSQLLSAYREQLSLLRRVGGLARNVMVRNDI